MPMPHRLTPLALVAVASSAWLVLPVGVSAAHAAEGNASAQEEALIKHGLELRAPGYLPVVRTVVVRARGLARERVVLVAAPAVTTIDVPQSKEPPAATTTPAPSPKLSTVPAATTATTISTSPAPAAGGT